MKKNIVVLSICLLCGSSFSLTGNDILKKMDRVRDYKTAQMNATMTIVNRDGHETVMSLSSYEKTDGDKSLMTFTKPARLDGTSILTVGDSIWYYNKRTNRVRLLSRSAKKGSMMGSSFSYEDMDADYAEDYNARIIEDRKNAWTLKLIPNDKDKTTAYMIADVPKDTFIPISVDYYREGDVKYKVLTNENIVNVSGHLTPLKVTMTELSSQKVTLFEIDRDSITFDKPLRDTLFSERSLKRQ